jgi:mannose-6-phosphate isomerase-like protein (cupin superfamily)
VIVRGHGEVVLDDEVIPVSEGKHVYIPVGAKHRIRNTAKEALEFVEVQVGSAFDERDIVRHQDDYSR